jgi:hypothetical protein
VKKTEPSYPDNGTGRQSDVEADETALIEKIGAGFTRFYVGYG